MFSKLHSLAADCSGRPWCIHTVVQCSRHSEGYAATHTPPGVGGEGGVGCDGGTESPSSLCALAKRRAPPEGLLPAARLSSAAAPASMTVNGSERNTLGLDASARAKEPCSRKVTMFMPRWDDWYLQKEHA